MFLGKRYFLEFGVFPVLSSLRYSCANWLFVIAFRVSSQAAGGHFPPLFFLYVAVHVGHLPLLAFLSAAVQVAFFAGHVPPFLFFSAAVHVELHLPALFIAGVQSLAGVLVGFLVWFLVGFFGRFLSELLCRFLGRLLGRFLSGLFGRLSSRPVLPYGPTPRS